MMMTPRFRSNDLRRTGVLVLLCVGVVALGLLFSGTIRDAATLLFTSTDNATRYALLPRGVLIERLSTFEAERARIEYQAVLYQDLAQKFAALEAEVALRNPGTYGTARVVSAPPRTHYDTLLIDAGSDAGVVVGDIASVGGIAVGVVTDASTYSALVQLYSSPGSEFDVSVGGAHALVVAHGVGGGSIEATIPNELSVTIGDTVTELKSGYVVGVVAEVLKREIDTTASLRIVIPVSPSTIRLVSLQHSL